MSPVLLIPPSAMIPAFKLNLSFASRMFIIEESVGIPCPDTILVVHMLPPPMPTLIESAPAISNAIKPSIVETFPAII